MLPLKGVEPDEEKELSEELQKCREQKNELRKKLEQLSGSGYRSLIHYTEERKISEDQSSEEKTFHQSPKISAFEKKYRCNNLGFGEIRGMQITRDSDHHNILAVCSSQARVYDFYSGKTLWELHMPGIGDGCISQDASMVTLGLRSENLYLFRLNELEGVGPHDPSAVIRDHTSQFRSMDMMDSQGCTMITADGTGNLITWDLSKCSQISQQSEVTSTVYSSEFNLRTGLLITGEDKGKVRVWDPRSDDPCVCPFYSYIENEIQTVRWFPDGYSVVAGNHRGQVMMFDMRSRKQVSNYETTQSSWSRVNSVDVSKSGRYIIAGYSGHIGCLLFDTLNGTREQTIDEYNSIRQVCFSDDGQSIILGSGDVAVWA